jgi:hypothetical protein
MERDGKEPVVDQQPPQWLCEPLHCSTEVLLKVSTMAREDGFSAFC